MRISVHEPEACRKCLGAFVNCRRRINERRKNIRKLEAHAERQAQRIVELEADLKECRERKKG